MAVRLRSFIDGRTYAFQCAFTFAMYQSFCLTIYPLLANKLGLSLSELISIFGVGSFLFLFSAPGFTFLSESFGAKSILILTMMGMLVSIFALLWALEGGFSQSESEMMLWVSRIIYGLFAGGVVPVSQTFFADHSGGGLLGRFALHAQATTLGRVLGPVLGYLAVEGYLFVVLSGLLLLVAMILFVGPWVATSRRSVTSLITSFRLIPKITGIGGLVFSVSIFAVAAMMVQASLAAHLQEIMQGSDLFSSVNAAIFALGNLVMVFSQRLIPYFSIKRLLMVASLCFFLSGLSFYYADSFVQVALGFGLFCLAVSGLRVGLSSYFCEINNGSVIGVIALISLVQTVGYALGNLLVSELLEVSLKSVFGGILVLNLALIIFVLMEGNKYERGSEIQLTKEEGPA